MSGTWSDLQEAVGETLGIGPVVFDKLVLSLGLILVAVVLRGLIDYLTNRRVTDISRRYVILKTVHYALGFVVLAIGLRVWVGDVTGRLATYLGLLSAGIALALKDTLTNLAGWVFLSTCKPFSVGDRIEIGPHTGDVIDIRLFQFSIVEVGNWVDADQSTGRIIHIPNGWVFVHPQSNYNLGFNFIWNELTVTVTFESDWEKAKGVLLDIAERHSAVQTEKAAEEVRKAARKYMVFFHTLTPIVWTSVADIGVTLTVRYLCEPRNRRASSERIWEETLRSFAKEDGIDFAYPTTRFFNHAAEGNPGRQPVTQAAGH